MGIAVVRGLMGYRDCGRRYELARPHGWRRPSDVRTGSLIDPLDHSAKTVPPVLGPTKRLLKFTFNKETKLETSYYFYTVDFEDGYGNHYFRLMTADKTLDHNGRMAVFQKELGSQYTVTAYEIDMDGGEMLENGITSHVFKDTYYYRALQGAV